MLEALERIKHLLSEEFTAGKGEDIAYAVPGLWSDPADSSSRRSVNPNQYYHRLIEWIETRPETPLIQGESGGEWSPRATVYNLFVRAATGFDHDGDGNINLEPIGAGWRETGTFLKSIALLPYIRHLGFNTIHLLPITAIGQDGNKGTLGSPYAIRNPYQIDPHLSEPVLGLDADTEFAAFVEAAHHLGLRIVVEFVFRTASKDADWVAEHPEWFYWIRADVPDRGSGSCEETAYGPPIFAPDELARIREITPHRDQHDLIPPHSVFREMFTEPPKHVEMVDGHWIGMCADGTQARIPGAFADWPPDDPQPPWGDVTYLRLYNHAEFDYIAYNTVRMYDRRLAQPENGVESLWARVIGILPHYQRTFGIDGVMIDMGHALPQRLKQRMVDATRQINPDFAFWDETFSIGQQSRDEGYNAVIGNYWWMAYRPRQMVHEMLNACSHTGYPVPFFAAPESHNTPRAAARPGGLAYARMVWALGCFLPALPFCHAGFEVGETLPVNTGLDFLPEELPRYPSASLPLFSEAVYDWNNESNLVTWIRQTLALRARYVDLITDPDPATFDLIATDNPQIWAIVRHRDARAIGVVFNIDWHRAQSFSLPLPTDRASIVDLLSGESHTLIDGSLRAGFPPSHCIAMEL